jgi:hypothetical protein
MKGSRPKASDSDQKKEVRWKNEDEACEGVPQDMRDKRGQKGLCKRCGYDNHEWQKCLASHPYSGKVENSPELRKKRAEIKEKRKTAGAKKRKADDSDTEVKTEAKKAKTAALTVRNGRLYEQDSDVDEDMPDF